MPKKESYKLKNPETSFYDDESRLEVTRDQVVEIGENAGKKTLAMIRKGGLIKVNMETQPPSGFDPKAGSKTPLNPGGATDDLSAGFPSRELLAAGGVTTGAQVDALDDAALGKIKGITPKLIEEIRAARKKSSK